MKKKYSIVGLVSLLVILFFACKDDKKPAETTNTPTKSEVIGQIYEIDSLKSKVEWKGFKIFKSENTSHFGSLKFESGRAIVNQKKIVGGVFVADITSLKNEDLKAEMKDKLETHLKSVDFFNIEKYPTASFEIIKVSDASENKDYNSLIEGKLNIKGITKEVKWYANIRIDDKNNLSIATEPTDISRKEFDLNFSIPVANGLLKDNISIQIYIKAYEKK